MLRKLDINSFIIFNFATHKLLESFRSNLLVTTFFCMDRIRAAHAFSQKLPAVVMIKLLEIVDGKKLLTIISFTMFRRVQDTPL